MNRKACWCAYYKIELEAGLCTHVVSQTAFDFSELYTVPYRVRVWCWKITIIWPLTSPLNTHRLTAAAVHSKAWCPATLQKLAKKGWRNKTKSLRHYNSASQEISSKASIHCTACTGTPINPWRLKPLKQVPKTSLPKFLCQPPDNTTRNSVFMP